MEERIIHFKDLEPHHVNYRLQVTKEEIQSKDAMAEKESVVKTDCSVTEGIYKFLDYCEKTGERPEKVFIDDKSYVVEWHPNKMFKRIYPKPLSYEEVKMIYLTNILPCQGTSGSDASKMLKKR